MRAQTPQQRYETQRRLQSLVAPGRRIGSVAGSYVTDLAEIQQAIILCWACEDKWKKIAKRYQYEARNQYNKIYGGVHGMCDGCREPGAQRRLYLHMSSYGSAYVP